VAHDDVAARAGAGSPWIVRAAQLHRNRWADERELANAIYGTVIGASVMVAASLHGTLVQILVTVLVTLLIYWAAERYATLLATGVHGPGGRLTRAEVTAVLRSGWPMVEAAYVPLLVLLVVTLLSRVQIGVLAALVTSTVLLVGLGYVGARRRGSGVAGAVGWAAGSGVLGLLAMGLKYLLH
jgi:hypothetical protein